MKLPFGNMQSFALYGGTFSPPHKGHLDVALQALKDLPVSQVVLLPALHNPLKENDYASFDDRFEMCRSMFLNHPMMLISKFEQEYNMSGYTIDNLRRIRGFYPEAKIWFIMGADCLKTFNQWKEYEQITSLVNLAIYPRTEQSSSQIRSFVKDKQYDMAKNMIDHEPIWWIIEKRKLYGVE